MPADLTDAERAQRLTAFVRGLVGPCQGRCGQVDHNDLPMTLSKCPTCRAREVLAETAPPKAYMMEGCNIVSRGRCVLDFYTSATEAERKCVLDALNAPGDHV